MTDRKPPSESFASWTERHIRDAVERGEFANLPGAGKPIPGLGRPYDELWWVKEKLRRENLALLPPTLALRKEAREALAAARRAGSEAEARRIVAEINGRIREAIAKPLSGPPLDLVPFDIEPVVHEWRERRHGEGGTEDRLKDAPARPSGLVRKAR